MNRTIYRATSILMLVLSLVGALAGAQTPRTAAPTRDEQAMSILTRMADFLSQAQRFSVMVDIGFDVVQESGQKIEFGETREVVVRRPDHARVDSTKRDGGTSGFIFDGKEIAVFNTRSTAMMPMAWMRRMAWSVPFVVLVVAVADLEAQRGGGGGGGEGRGGGGFSRSGAASSGMFGAPRSGGGSLSSSGVASSGNWQINRADMQASSQASREQQQASRQQQQASSQASRQSQQQELQSSRQSSAQELQSTRSQEKATAREDWQSYGTQRQEDRQSYGEQARHQRQDYADDYLDDYHGHYYGSYPVGAGLAAATGVAVGTAISASAFQSMSCPMTPVIVNGYTYYQCGSTWYQPTYQGGQVTYIVVNPPN